MFLLHLIPHLILSAHEYTHIGLEKVFKLAKKNPKAFKEKYGEDAYGLIATSTETIFVMST